MSIHKRGKQGIYYFNFTINGKKYFRSTGTTSKREAKQVEHSERQRLMKEGKLSPQEKAARTPLKDAIEITYLSKWKNNKDATGTHRKALRLLEIIGNVPVGQITEETVDTLIKTLEATGIVGATINRYQAVIKCILKQLKQPADIFTQLKESQGRKRVMTPEEGVVVLALLRGTGKPVYMETADLVECLGQTGCRLSEILDSTYKENINFDTNLISLFITKSGKARSIPMSSKARTILLERQASNSIKPFTITKYQADKCWAWVRKQMGLEDDKEFVIHCATRHTFSSTLLNNDISLATIRDLLGHSSIKITEKVYAHLDPKKLVHAIKVLEVIPD
jgi:integrase